MSQRGTNQLKISEMSGPGSVAWLRGITRAYIEEIMN